MKLSSFFVLLASLLLTACAPNYSEGVRAGVVTKLSYKGLVFKSWEGSLNQGGTKNSTDSNGNAITVTNAIDFNVQDPAVVKVLEEAMASGAKVELKYSQWFLRPFTIENSRVITAVKVLP